jgi:DNA-binding transcriptional LysR family regulator
VLEGVCRCGGAAGAVPDPRRELKVRVDGQLVFNSLRQCVDAALAGLGLAYIPEDAVQPQVERGALIRVLEDWCPPFPGYHLYYLSRRQTSPAFALFVEALRYSCPPTERAKVAQSSGSGAGR